LTTIGESPCRSSKDLFDKLLDLFGSSAEPLLQAREDGGCGLERELLLDVEDPSLVVVEAFDDIVYARVGGGGRVADGGGAERRTGDEGNGNCGGVEI
jgi:hypothetical protein